MRGIRRVDHPPYPPFARGGKGDHMRRRFSAQQKHTFEAILPAWWTATFHHPSPLPGESEPVTTDRPLVCCGGAYGPLAGVRETPPCELPLRRGKKNQTPPTF